MANKPFKKLRFSLTGDTYSPVDETARQSIGDLSELDTENKNNLVEAINEAARSGSSVSPYNSNPAAPGTASPGSSADYARGDHVHPVDTSRASAAVVGDLNDLNTSDKSSIVAAINEIADNAVDPEDIQNAVDTYLDEHPTITGTFTNAAKQALIALLEKVAYIIADGQQYLSALETELFAVSVASIVAQFNQGTSIIYDTYSLNDLIPYLTVTVYYEDNTSEILPPSAYSLSGTLTAGTSTITVSYQNVNDSFQVTVTQALPNTYTKYDYIEQTNSTSTAQSTNNMIRLKTYANLNRLGLKFPIKTTQVQNGLAIIGGRTSSGSTSSLALYSGNAVASGSLGYHIHGVDTNLTISLIANQRHSVELIASTTSPTILTVDNDEYSVSWSNDNTINTRLTLFSNPINDTSQRLSAYIQIGEIMVYDTSNNLINYYIPCVRTADQIIGMYDVIDEIFYSTPAAEQATIGNSSCRYAVGNWS